MHGQKQPYKQSSLVLIIAAGSEHLNMTNTEKHLQTGLNLVLLMDLLAYYLKPLPTSYRCA